MKVLTLCFNPFLLPHIARECRGPVPILVAASSVFLQILCLFAIGGAGVSEPYRSLGDYLFAVITLAPKMATIPVPFTAGFAAIGLLWGRGASWRSVRTRVYILSFVPLLLPVLLWLSCGMFAQVASPHFGLPNKPAWVFSPILQFAASGWWIMIFVVGLVLLIRWSFRFLKRDLSSLDGLR